MNANKAKGANEVEHESPHQITPMEHFDQYCKPILTSLQATVTTLADQNKAYAINAVEQTKEIDQITKDLQEISTDLRKVFRDNGGPSLIAQLGMVTSCVTTLEENVNKHFREHDEAKSTWKNAGRRLLVTLSASFIIFVCGMALLGVKSKLENRSDAVLLRRIEHITEMKGRCTNENP